MKIIQKYFALGTLLSCWQIHADSRPVVPEQLIYPVESIEVEPAAKPQSKISDNGGEAQSTVEHQNIQKKNIHPLVAILKEVYLHSPKLQSARMQIAIQQSQSQQILSQYYPSLNIVGTLEVSRDRFDHRELSGHPTKIGLVLNQSLFDRSTQLAFRSAQTEEKVAQLVSTLQDQDIIHEICKRYLDLYRFARLAEFARNNAGLAHEHFRSTQIRQQKGELTLTDVNQAIVRYKTALAIKEESKVQMEISQHRFSELTQSIAPLKPELFDLSIDQKEISAFLEPDKVHHRPDLRVISARKEKEEYQVQLAQSRYFPRLDLSVEQGRTWDNSSTITGSPLDETIVTLNLNWNLYSGHLTSEQALEASLKKSQLNYNYLHQQREAQRLIQEASLNVQMTDQLSSAYKEAVEAAKKALYGIQEEFLAGTRTALDAFDAQNELFVSQTRWLNAKVDHLLSTIVLLKSVGNLNLEQFTQRMSIDHSLDD